MNKITATIMMVAAMLVMTAMYFSEKFIPVWVNGEYVLANQIIRYIIYFVLFIVVMYDFAYLISSPNHQKRRRK